MSAGVPGIARVRPGRRSGRVIKQLIYLDKKLSMPDVVNVMRRIKIQ